MNLVHVCTEALDGNNIRGRHLARFLAEWEMCEQLAGGQITLLHYRTMFQRTRSASYRSQQLCREAFGHSPSAVCAIFRERDPDWLGDAEPEAATA